MYAPISLRRKVFEASAPGCLKTLYSNSSRHARSVSWAVHFHPQGWPSGPKRLTTEYRSFRKRRPCLVGWRHAPPRGPPAARSGFVAQRPPKPLASYFQTCPMTSAAGARTGGWVRFCKTVGVRKLGSLRSRAKPDWLRIFKLAIGPPLGYRTVRWLRSYKPCVSTPIGFVAQSGPSSESWLRKKRLFFAFLR